MDPQAVFFYIFAAIAIGCALMTVFKKSPVASAFSLVLVFFAFAGIYAILNAHLIATLQVLVYAGAIMVLFIFVIMLLNADVPSLDLAKTRPAAKILIGTGTLALLALFVFAFKSSVNVPTMGAYTAEKVAASGGNTRVISELMFTEYLLPFELTSLLILAATVGAVAIAKRKMTVGEKGGPNGR